MSKEDITPEELEICLRVLHASAAWEEDDPRARQVQWAAAGAVKRFKKLRRAARKRERRETDLNLLEQAAIHSVPVEHADQVEAPESILLEGELIHAQICYVCKESYRRVHHFYHAMCPTCAQDNWARRTAACDLRGRRALLTGGRIKIGFHLGLKLLRDGASLIVTTRFPKDALRRFREVSDSDDWIDRLEIRGIDLRDVRAVEALCAELLEGPPLDILIHNAAQTVWRPPVYYQALAQGEHEGPAPSSALVRQDEGLERFHALCLGAEADDRFPQGALDVEGKQLDLRAQHSWRLMLDEIEPVEMVEAWVVTTLAPFLFNTRLKPSLMRSTFPDRYIVNVSAVEGQFAYKNKTSHHAHTNMAKAAMNMMTRTSGADYADSGIFMTSVDTGWITDENVEHVRERMRGRGFRPPLDVVDGAARVYDPVVRGIAEEERLHSVFLKDYRVCAW